MTDHIAPNPYVFVAAATDEIELEFHPGCQLQSGGGYFRVLSESTPQRMRIQDIHTGDIRVAEQTLLKLAIAQGQVTVFAADHAVPAVHLQFRSPGLYEEWIKEIPTSMRSESAIQVMVSKSEWIKRLKQHKVTKFQPSPILQMKILELERLHGEKCPYGTHTLYKAWRTLKRNDGAVNALLPRFDRRGGAGQSRLDPEVDAIVSKVLSGLDVPGSHKLQVSTAHSSIVAAVKQSNIGRDGPQRLAAPSEPTVSRRFHEYFDAYEITKRNYGVERANRLFRSNGARVQAGRALDVVMYDDTDSCVFLVDDRTGLPWGRGWVTPGVDEYSSSVTGLSMSEQHRSTASATEAVMHSLAEKDAQNSDFDLCRGNWYAYGNQGLIVLDNASYNQSCDFQASLVDLGIEYEFARPHHPTNKTCVEYFHHRMKTEFCRHLPGWSGPKEDRELLDVGIGTTVASHTEFRQKLFRWIVDDYSNKPMHRGKTPRQLWDESFAFHPPFLPRRMPSQELLGTIPSTLKFRDSGGLLRNKLRYQSEELDLLRRHLGYRAEVKIRYRADSLSFIYVQDPRRSVYLKVPCVEAPEVYAGLSDWQWRLVLKRARAMCSGNISIIQAVAARQKLQEETSSLRFSKKMRERKRAVQFQIGAEANAIGKDKPLPALTESVVMSDLESLTVAIDDDLPDSSPEMNAVFFGEDT